MKGTRMFYSRGCVGREGNLGVLHPRVPGSVTVKGTLSIYNEGYPEVLQTRVPGSFTVKGTRKGYRQGYPSVLRPRVPGRVTDKGTRKVTVKCTWTIYSEGYPDNL